MQERPKAVTETVQILTVNAGCFLAGALLLLPVPVVFADAAERVFACTIELLLFGMAAIYAILGYGFHNLRPWAYNPVKYLVRLDRLSSLAGLPKKVDQNEVRRAFGLNHADSEFKP